ncbi:MAG: hypothetical protein K2Y32_06240 [Candidatus Obscuribacterales bacterium]|nr:hypothetical protein [Candidatus Obscuribacterales bacterium]
MGDSQYILVDRQAEGDKEQPKPVVDTVQLLRDEPHKVAESLQGDSFQIVDRSQLVEEVIAHVEDVKSNLNSAKAAALEIGRLDKEHANPQDKIKVTDSNGNEVEMTVDERVKQLKREIDTQFSNAIKKTDNEQTAKQQTEALTELVKQNTIERVVLSQKLGIDLVLSNPGEVRAQIDTLMRQEPNNPDLRRMNELQTEMERLRSASELSSATKMIYAQYMAAGLTNEKYGLEKGENGKLLVDPKDVQLAAHMIIQAGENKDFRDNPTYQKALASVGEHLGVKDRAEAITKKVSEAAIERDPAKKEAMLKEAVEETKKIGLDKLATLYRDPEFMARQSQEVQDRIKATVDSANNARLEYMRLLTSQGRTTDAEKLMVQIKADDPGAVGRLEKNGDKLEFKYNTPEWQALDNQMALGTSTIADHYRQLGALYNQKMSEGQLTSSGRGANAGFEEILKNGANRSDIGADQILKAMKLLTMKREEERKQSVIGLDAEIKGLKAELAALPGKAFDVEAKRDMAREEIEDKLRVLEATKLQLEENAKLVNAFEDAERRMLVINRYCMLNERSSASQELEALKREHPEYWNNRFNNDQKEEIELACEYVPWYKDWRTYAVIGAGIVGAVVGFGVASAATSASAVGAAVTWLGVSKVVAGVGLAAVGTAGGVVLGGIAGGRTYYRAHQLADWLGMSNQYDKANLEEDFRQGYRIGSLTGGIGAMVPGAAAAIGLRHVEKAAVDEAVKRGLVTNYLFNVGKSVPLSASFNAANEASRWAMSEPGKYHFDSTDFLKNTATFAALSPVGANIHKVPALLKVPIPALHGPKAMLAANFVFAEGMGQTGISVNEHLHAYSNGSDYNPDTRIGMFSPANGYVEDPNSRAARQRIYGRYIQFDELGYFSNYRTLQSQFVPPEITSQAERQLAK